jgi:hypothetical protein
MAYLPVSGVFPKDQWPANTRVIDGVTRKAFYSYEVEEPTAVMIFSDAGEVNNPDGINRIIVELAVLKIDDFENNLAGMISAVTQDLEPETIHIDRVVQRYQEAATGLTAIHAFFCHPDTSEGILRVTDPLGIPVAAHKAFPTPTEGAVTLLVCDDLPGLIAHSEEGSGAFIFPEALLEDQGYPRRQLRLGSPAEG